MKSSGWRDKKNTKGTTKWVKKTHKRMNKQSAKIAKKTDEMWKYYEDLINNVGK